MFQDFVYKIRPVGESLAFMGQPPSCSPDSTPWGARFPAQEFGEQTGMPALAVMLGLGMEKIRKHLASR